ncbi:MAG: hypothetical protein RIC95_12925 [Vicingaceae bacterium]
MNRLGFMLTVIVFVSCGGEDIPISKLPLEYEAYNDNLFDRLVWKLQGIDTIYYGGELQLNKNDFTYKGCYCIVKGEWEQRNDTLFLHNEDASYQESLSYNPKVNCLLLDSIYQIRNNGTLLRVLNGREDDIQLYQLKEL